MAYRARKGTDAMHFALVKAFNETREGLVGSNFHYDITDVSVTGDYRDPTQTNLAVAAANATDEATLVTLVNEIKADYGIHIADTIAHTIADATNAVTNADATDAATAVTLVNEIKADYNAHLTESGVHPNNDGTNNVTNANATDQATAITLANEIKGDLNAHITAALGGHSIRLVDP